MAAMLCVAPCGALALTPEALAEGGIPVTAPSGQQDETAILSVEMPDNVQLHILEDGTWNGVVAGEDTATLTVGETYEFRAHVDEGQILASVTMNGNVVECAYEEDNEWSFAVQVDSQEGQLVISTQDGSIGEEVSLSVAVDGDSDVQLLIPGADGTWNDIELGEDVATLVTGHEYKFIVGTMGDGFLIDALANSEAVPTEEIDPSGSMDRAWHFSFIATQNTELVFRTASVETLRQQIAVIDSVQPAPSLIAVPVLGTSEPMDVGLSCVAASGGEDGTTVVWTIQDPGSDPGLLVSSIDGMPIRGEEALVSVDSEILGGDSHEVVITAVALTTDWITAEPDMEDVLQYLAHFAPIYADLEVEHAWTLRGIEPADFPAMDVAQDSGLAIEADTNYVFGLEVDGPDVWNAAGAVVNDFMYNVGAPWAIVNKEGQPLASEDRVGTGCRIQSAAGTTEDVSGSEPPYVFCVQGDVLGTGTMSLAQLVRFAAAYRGDSRLEEAYLRAADFNLDGGITLVDLVAEADLYRESQAAE